MTTTPYSHGYLRLAPGAKYIGGTPLPIPKSEPIQVRADPGSHPDMELGPVRMSREQAQGMGYTGDMCSHCGSSQMKHTGHCNTCEACGTTTGCS